MKKEILFLGFAVLISGETAFAIENTTIPDKFSGQSCGLSDNRLCDAVTNILVKELLKQTVYTVGTQVLNKYMNTTVTIPVTTTTPVVYTPAAAPVTTPAPVVYTPAASPAPLSTTTTTVPEEQMIIVN
ncbi:MAG: hypothetical protein WCG23_00580 [bacterium]